MKEFLTKIVSAIVSDSSAIEILEAEENGLSIYTIAVPEDEVGKVIGKGGKVINAIRCLARLKAIKSGERILIKVEAKTANQNGNGFSFPTSTTEPSEEISG